eukprot:1119993-Lingulodinium_polyedra.AAC.1
MARVLARLLLTVLAPPNTNRTPRLFANASTLALSTTIARCSETKPNTERVNYCGRPAPADLLPSKMVARDR